jgi:hypothetical protein
METEEIFKQEVSITLYWPATSSSVLCLIGPSLPHIITINTAITDRLAEAVFFYILALNGFLHYFCKMKLQLLNSIVRN